MSRTRTSTALLLLASIAVAAGCTRNNPTAPSEPPQPQYEHQGADN
jgi:uncharacterized lipoprotein YajG